MVGGAGDEGRVAKSNKVAVKSDRVGEIESADTAAKVSVLALADLVIHEIIPFSSITGDG